MNVKPVEGINSLNSYIEYTLNQYKIIGTDLFSILTRLDLALFMRDFDKYLCGNFKL